MDKNTFVIAFYINDITFIHEMSFIPPIGTTMIFENIIDEVGNKYRYIEETVEGYRWFNISDVDLEITLSNNTEYMD